MPLPNPKSEIIKAKLRIRYGSLLRFEREKGLPYQSVTDVLRGRSNRRVAAAIEDAVGSVSIIADDSTANAENHRLNGGAK